MSIETSTKPPSKIARIAAALFITVGGYYGYNRAGDFAKGSEGIFKIISAIVCFAGLYVIFKVIIELVNERNKTKR